MAQQKNGWLLGSGPNAYTNQRFLSEAQSLGVPLLFRSLAQIPLAFPRGTEFFFGEKPDFILTRLLGGHFDDFDLEALTFLEDLGCATFNSSRSLRLSRSKLTQARNLSACGLPLLPCFTFRGPWNEQRALDLHQHFSHSLQDKGISWGQDFVLKFERGHQGKGVILAKGVESLGPLWESFESLGDQRLIITPFVAGPGVRELRLLFIAGKVRLILERFAAAGDFRANYHAKVPGKGQEKGRASQVLKSAEVPSFLIEEASKALTTLGLFYGSVDLFWTPSGALIIEVNSVPGIEEAEALSGENLSKEILLSIWQEIR